MTLGLRTLARRISGWYYACGERPRLSEVDSETRQSGSRSSAVMKGEWTFDFA